MVAWVKPSIDATTRNIITKFDGGVSAGWYMQVNKDVYRAYRKVVPCSVLTAEEMTFLATH